MATRGDDASSSQDTGAAPTSPPASSAVTAADEANSVEPPPGFEDVAPGTYTPAADALASSIQGLQVDGAGAASAAGVTGDDDTDAPDPSLARSAVELDQDDKQEETVIQKVVNNGIYTSAASFEELGLSKELLQGIYSEMRFTKPSKIQAETLPMIIMPPNANLIAQAHNGSGKTTCFVLGMLSRVNPALRHPQALCMCPTRELVVQNRDVAQKMGKHTGITIATTADEEVKQSRDTISAQVIFGTPGTVKNWVSKGRLALGGLQILVFDEADEMVSIDSFAADSARLIKDIRAKAPRCQTLLFSATFSEHAMDFAKKSVTRPNVVSIPKEQLSLDVIKQYRVECATERAKETVLQTIFPLCEKLGQAIVFVRTRKAARSLHELMSREGHKCTSIEGSMEHADRDRVIAEFRAGTTKILISTDILSRGFDCSAVTLVVNYDMPTERQHNAPAFETYMHRIGRSGRFGRKGAAFNLVLGAQEDRILTAISRHFNKDIPSLPATDEEAFEKVLKEAGLA